MANLKASARGAEVCWGSLQDWNPANFYRFPLLSWCWWAALVEFYSNLLTVVV